MNNLMKLSLIALVMLLAGCSAGANLETGTDALNVSTADDVQRISVTEAKALLDAEKAVLYDSRSVASYNAQHAAGAVSLPVSEVEARHNELPTDKSLIFYCT